MTPANAIITEMICESVFPVGEATVMQYSTMGARTVGFFLGLLFSFMTSRNYYYMTILGSIAGLMVICLTIFTFFVKQKLKRYKYDKKNSFIASNNEISIKN